MADAMRPCILVVVLSRLDRALWILRFHAVASGSGLSMTIPRLAENRPDRKMERFMKGLSENFKPRVNTENESGKSRRFLSFISEFLTHLRYVRLAKFDGFEFSDTPMKGDMAARQFWGFSAKARTPDGSCCGACRKRLGTVCLTISKRT